MAERTVEHTNAAVADLTAALAEATGRHYQYLDTIDEARLAAANTVADNGTDAIRSGIIYDGDAVVPVGQTALYYQGDQNRPTLAQTFRPAAGIHPERQTFTVVVNHFRSKGSPCGPASDDPFQGNCNGMRLSMATNVATWLEGNPKSDPADANRRYVVIGDFNAYFGEDPIQALVRNGAYTDLIDRLIGDTAYSFNFGSQVGYLDHALANAAALALVKDVAELHINADEPPALQALDSGVKSAAARRHLCAQRVRGVGSRPDRHRLQSVARRFHRRRHSDARDRTALLDAIEHGNSGHGSIDRRMDMNHDGVDAGGLSHLAAGLH
jgi:predicted extracellular nuclease